MIAHAIPARRSGVCIVPIPLVSRLRLVASRPRFWPSDYRGPRTPAQGAFRRENARIPGVRGELEHGRGGFRSGSSSAAGGPCTRFCNSGVARAVESGSPATPDKPPKIFLCEADFQPEPWALSRVPIDGTEGGAWPVRGILLRLFEDCRRRDRSSGPSDDFWYRHHHALVRRVRRKVSLPAAFDRCLEVPFRDYPAISNAPPRVRAGDIHASS